MRHKPIITLFCLLLLATVCPAQQQVWRRPDATASVFALKSNLLYDATVSFDLGAEFRIAPRWSLDLPFSCNPFTYSDNSKWKHFRVQPEARYWLCEPFMKHFLGVHAHYAIYNVGGIGFPGLRDHRYEGWLLGVGVSYGYQWHLSPRWNIEASLGLGYAYLNYDRYECVKCGEFLNSGRKNYVGPTRAAVSLIYIIR